MSCITRNPNMWTNTGLHHSEIKETWWSSVTCLTHGPLSQYYRVEDECRDNQHPCTSQCQASWTWPVNWPLVYYQDHPKSMNYEILSTAWYTTQYDPYMHEYPQGLRFGLLQTGQPQNDHVIYRVGPVILSKQVVVVKVAVIRRLILNYGLSTLLTAYPLPETGQGLLNRSHGGRWFVPNWCLNWFMSSWCSLIEGVINKIYNLLHHVLG